MHTMSPNAGGNIGERQKLRKLEMSEKPVKVDFAAAPRVNTTTSLDGTLGRDAEPGAKIDELRTQCVAAHAETQQNFGRLDVRTTNLETEVTRLAQLAGEMQKAIVDVHDNQVKIDMETTQLKDDLTNHQATLVEMGERNAAQSAELATHTLAR